MSGNDAVLPVETARRRRPPADGFPESLGSFFEDPVGFLRRARTDVPRAALVLLLSLAGEFLTETLRKGAERPLAEGLRSVAAGFAFWYLAAALWHGVSRLAGREGSYRRLLTLLGWSRALYWFALPAALAASALGLPGWTSAAAQFAAEIGFLYLAWTSLRAVYGWPGVKGALVLLLPLSLAAAVLALFAAAAAMTLFGGMIFSKLLF